MKYAEINRKFTEKVTEYIGNGYTFNTATMSGSQGEISKVDLTDGSEIVRIALKRYNPYGFYGDGVELTVGVARNKDGIKPNDPDTWRTLWNNDLEVICKEAFCKPFRGGDWYVDEETARANYDKAMERYTSRYSNDRKEFSGKAGEIALKYVRRQRRCKTAKLADVKVMKEDGKFRVTYKDHHWILK